MFKQMDKKLFTILHSFFVCLFQSLARLTHFSIERMPGKPVVPAYMDIIMFCRDSSQLGRIELGEERPDLIHRRQEQDVCVNIQDGINI